MHIKSGIKAVLTKNKYLLKIVLIFLGISLCFFGGANNVVQAEDGLVANNWWRNLQTAQRDQMYNLEREELHLPVNEYRSFSEEGKAKLYDLAARFGEEDPENELEFDKWLTSDPNEQKQNNLFSGEGELHIDSRLSLIGDSTSEDGDVGLSGFDLQYSLNESTTLSAGMDGVFESGLKTEDPPVDADREDYDGENNISTLEVNFPADDRAETENRTNWNQQFEGVVLSEDSSSSAYEEERAENESGILGITYQPTDNISLSADYIYSNIFSPEHRSSAALGLEYNDQLGNFRARYQIEEGELLYQTTTDLELEVMDFAMLSASYTLLDMEKIEDKLQQQTRVDLGLDFSFTEFSTFSFGYQWQENYLNMFDEDDGDNESNIRASFTIDF